MSRRNQVTVEFRVVGDGLAALERAHASFRSFGGVSTMLGSLSTSFTGAARGAQQLAQQTAGVTSGLQRIGEIAAGSLSGNVLASIFTGAAAAAANFARESMGAALSAEQALVVLRTQSRLSGTDLEKNIELAKRVAAELKVSDTAGVGIATGALKAASAAGRPQDTELFLKRVADLAAAAGRPMSDLQEIFRQIGSGDVGAEAAFDKILGGKNPSQLYDEVAKSLGRTADSLTTAEKAQIRFNAVLSEGVKVQGVAAESLNSNAGRVSALDAAYTNLQTKVGEAIVKSEAFKNTLTLLEKAAAGASSPEFAKNIESIGSALSRVAQAGALIIGTFALIGNAVRTFFDLVFGGINYLVTAFSSLGTAIGASITAGAATAIEGLQAILPTSVQGALGIAGINTNTLKGKAVSDLTGVAAEFAALNDATAKILKEDAERFKTILDTTGAAVKAFNSGGTTDQILAASQGTTAPAASSDGQGITAKLRYKPLVTTIEFDGETIRSVDRRDGVIVENTKSNEALQGSVDELTGTVGLLLENPAIARVEVVAGQDTTIKSVVPTGGANQP